MKRKENVWVWAAFVAILALYLISALRLNPTATFGFFRDDGIYYASAKALAAGQGDIPPNFPGHLRTAKFPELYPLVLAGVWKLDPHFPGNIRLAVGLTLGFGCLALLVTFLMLRQWTGLGDWPALAIVLLIGLSSWFLYLSPKVLSDIPFMTLLLGAAWLAERSMAQERGSTSAAAAGLLAGMSVGLRSLGVPVAAGIGLLLLVRREFRRLFWFCLTGFPLTLLWSWTAVKAVLGLSQPAVTGDPSRSGWTQTVCYYSSYACEWRMSVPNLAALKSAILLNLQHTAQVPGQMLLSALTKDGGVVILVLVILLSVASYVGIARQWHREGARPLHAIFPLFLLVIMLYPFSTGRFLVGFSPLFLAGLWLEGGRVFRVVKGRLRDGCGKDERVAAWLLGLGALAVAATVAFNYAYALPREIGDWGAQREAVYADELGAYTWLREHAGQQARIIAHEDGAGYLYTGKPTVRPIATLIEVFYLQDPRYAERDAAHLADVARHIGASYWLTTPSDYLVETAAGRAVLRSEEQKLLATAPVVYRSADGQVVLYDTHCLWAKDTPGCVRSEAVAAPWLGKRSAGGRL